MRKSLLLIPLVPAIAIGIGLVAREFADDPIVVVTEGPAIAPKLTHPAPPVVPAPCGPNCGTDA